MKTPLRTIRDYCLRCAGFQTSLVRDCVIGNCPLYFYRFGVGFRSQKFPGSAEVPPGTRFSPMRAIRKHCLECMAGHPSQVAGCRGHGGDCQPGDPPCELYPFRFGKRPATVAKKRNAAREESEAA